MKHLIYYIAIIFAVACSESEGGSGSTPNPNPNPTPTPPPSGEVVIKSAGSIGVVDNGSVESMTAAWNNSGANEIDSFVANSSVVNGGVIFVNFVSDNRYSHLIVGSGTKALRIVADAKAVTGGYSYSVPIFVGQDVDADFSVLIAGEKSGGVQTKPYSHSVDIQEVRSEGLQIVMSFDSDEDMDLHLFMPMTIGDGKELFFGNPGLCDNFEQVICGFDVMANNDCQGLEAGLRYESISIPDSHLESGLYTAKVNLYSVCTAYPERATNYAVCGYYDGELLAMATGSLDGDDENRTDTNAYTKAFDVTLDLSDAVSVRSAAIGNPIKLGRAEQAKMYYRGW